MSALLDGQVIRARREALGLTLQAVADQAGVTRQYVSSVESNKIQLVPPGVARIVEAVGLSFALGPPVSEDFPPRFFTYGSMKPGFLRHGLVAGSLPEGHQAAVLAGYRLYDSDLDYPCLIRSDQATDLVHGTLFSFGEQAIRRALKTFDVIEGVDDDPPLFVRHRSVALVAEGERDQVALPCWVYLYAQAVDGMKQIKDGNWKKVPGRTT